MGKASRLRAQRRSAAPTKDHVKIMDAARVVEMAERMALHVARQEDGVWKKRPPDPHLNPEYVHGAEIAASALNVWQGQRVMLRADADFAAALLDTDTDVELVPDWLDRMPYDSLGYSLSEPLSLHDGTTLCHYRGFLAIGTRSRETGRRRGEFEIKFTEYIPLAGSEGIRFAWLYNSDGDPTPRIQTVTVSLRGDASKQGMTVGGLIDLQRHLIEKMGGEWGQELSVLVPLSVQLAMYTAALEPDLDWVPPERRSHHRELNEARVGNVGWRVGAALRTHRKQAPRPRQEPGRRVAGGWRVPSHVRRAHWHRVRVATRDVQGRIVGDRSGEQGADWEYVMRWYPPTPVNAERPEELGATVRDVHREDAP